MKPQKHGFNRGVIDMGYVSNYVIIFMHESKMWKGSGLIKVHYGGSELGEKRMKERNRRRKRGRMNEIKRSENKKGRMKSGKNARNEEVLEDNRNKGKNKYTK
jgi:hypothetical protein